MNKAQKIVANNLRIAKLKSRNNGLNGNIVKKLERQNRALERQL